jgi:hypothetical protein
MVLPPASTSTRVRQNPMSISINHQTQYGRRLFFQQQHRAYYSVLPLVLHPSGSQHPPFFLGSFSQPSRRPPLYLFNLNSLKVLQEGASGVYPASFWHVLNIIRSPPWSNAGHSSNPGGRSLCFFRHPQSRFKYGFRFIESKWPCGSTVSASSRCFPAFDAVG